MPTVATKRPMKTLMLTYDSGNAYAQSIVHMLGLSNVFQIEESPYDSQYVHESLVAAKGNKQHLDIEHLWD